MGAADSGLAKLQKKVDEAMAVKLPKEFVHDPGNNLKINPDAEGEYRQKNQAYQTEPARKR